MKDLKHSERSSSLDPSFIPSTGTSLACEISRATSLFVQQVIARYFLVASKLCSKQRRRLMSDCKCLILLMCTNSVCCSIPFAVPFYCSKLEIFDSNVTAWHVPWADFFCTTQMLCRKAKRTRALRKISVFILRGTCWV